MRQHPLRCVDTSEVHACLQQRDGDPPGSAHQLKDLPLHLNSFGYVELDVEFGGHVQVVHVGHAIVVDQVIGQARIIPALVSWCHRVPPLDYEQVRSRKDSGIDEFPRTPYSGSSCMQPRSATYRTTPTYGVYENEE